MDHYVHCKNYSGAYKTKTFHRYQSMTRHFLYCQLQCSSEITDQRQHTRKMHAPFLCIGIRYARGRQACMFSLVIHSIKFLSVSLFGWTNDCERLLFSNRNKYLFFCQNVHMPWVSNGSMKLTVNEMHCNLDCTVFSIIVTLFNKLDFW